MITIKIDVDHIDYSELAEKVFPVVAEKLEKQSNSAFLSAVIKKTKGLSGATLKAALSVLPQSTKDELAVLVLQQYKDQVVKQLNTFAEEQGVELSISDIQVEKD